MSIKINNRIIGKMGEDLAEMVLTRDGYRIIRRNYSCPFGEIDIIARKDSTMAFVEVKTRTTSRFGDGREAVDLKKEEHIKRAINAFVKDSNWAGRIEFQVIEIQITHLKNLQFKEA